MPIYTTEGYQITQGVCKSGHFPSSNTHAHSIHFTDFLYKIPSMRAFNSPLSCRINSECIHDRVSPQSAMFLRGSKLHGSTLLVTLRVMMLWLCVPIGGLYSLLVLIIISSRHRLVFWPSLLVPYVSTASEWVDSIHATPLWVACDLRARAKTRMDKWWLPIVFSGITK